MLNVLYGRKEKFSLALYFHNVYLAHIQKQTEKLGEQISLQ